jgi:hypothetical protein
MTIVSRCVAIIAVVSWAAHVQAAPIAYDVSLAIGTGNVSGSITTDGTIGLLSSGNFTAWNITIFDGIDSDTLVNGDSSSIVTSPTSLVEATATALLFNFDPGAIVARNFLLTRGSGATTPYWNFSAQANTDGTVGGNYRVSHFHATSTIIDHQQLVNPQGDVVFATVPSNGIPLPSTLALFALGLLAMRRRTTA